MPRATTASRRLLFLLFVVAGLALPSAAGSQPSFTITRHVVGTLGANGWYVSNVQVYWTFDPPPDQTQGCDARTVTTDGPTSFDCVAWWGTSRFDDSFTINVDKTPPTGVHGVPSRPPDANGWYNKPVSVSFAGSDATSGLAGCSSATYSGPANGNASVSGTCTDNAGNVSYASYGFSYDSTPPTVGNLTAKHGNRNVLLSWTVSADTQVSQVTRTGGASGPSQVVYRGSGTSFLDKGLQPGVKYQYAVTAFDPAANAATTSLDVTATGRLINPVPGQVVTSRPRLAWLPVKHASYYNVQLIRGRRILSAWPRRTNFKIPATWVYHGHRYHLRPGVYRWYVWPGYGKLAQAQYGRLLGGSSFVYSR